LNKTYLNAKPIVIFVLGAVAGAASINSISFVCIVIPVVLILFLMVEEYWKIKELEAAVVVAVAVAQMEKAADIEASNSTTNGGINTAVISNGNKDDNVVLSTGNNNSSKHGETKAALEEKETTGNFGIAPSYRATVE
jgi:hypothetical protein